MGNAHRLSHLVSIDSCHTDWINEGRLLQQSVRLVSSSNFWLEVAIALWSLLSF